MRHSYLITRDRDTKYLACSEKGNIGHSTAYLHWHIPSSSPWSESHCSILRVPNSELFQGSQWSSLLLSLLSSSMPRSAAFHVPCSKTAKKERDRARSTLEHRLMWNREHEIGVGRRSSVLSGWFEIYAQIIMCRTCFLFPFCFFLPALFPTLSLSFLTHLVTVQKRHPTALPGSGIQKFGTTRMSYYREKKYWTNEGNADFIWEFGD